MTAEHGSEGVGAYVPHTDALDDAIVAALEEAPSVTASRAAEAGDRARAEGGHRNSVPHERNSADGEEQSTGPAAPNADTTAMLGIDPPSAVEAPGHFTAELKALFAALPPAAQEAVARIERAREAEYTRRTQELSEFRRAADPWMAAVSPFAEYLHELSAQHGATPSQLLGQLLAAEYMLRTGDPHQKLEQFVGLAQSYGVDLAGLNHGGVAASDALISQLRQQVSDLAHWRAQHESRAAQDLEFSRRVDALGAAKDEHGRPRFPYSERLRAPMLQHLATGEATTMEEAYAKAMEPIHATVAAELAERHAATEKVRQAAVDKARKALPVRTSGAQPGSAAASDLDSLISASMQKAGIA